MCGSFNYGSIIQDIPKFMTLEEHEDAMLKYILEDVIKKGATPENAKLLTRVFHIDRPDEYALLFNGEAIGHVKLTRDVYNPSVSFMPVDKFNQVLLDRRTKHANILGLNPEDMPLDMFK